MLAPYSVALSSDELEGSSEIQEGTSETRDNIKPEIGQGDATSRGDYSV